MAERPPTKCCNGVSSEEGSRALLAEPDKGRQHFESGDRAVLTQSTGTTQVGQTGRWGGRG